VGGITLSDFDDGRTRRCGGIDTDCVGVSAKTKAKAGHLLSKSEAAREMGIGIRGLEGLMRRKALSFHRISSRCVRFDPDEIRKFLDRTEVKSLATLDR